ncbi:hypothetical protein COCOBI_08-0470 [Coccomyxa sp. Obi]|nr:hypothetical protein COCOBI_08-0470 [Coccomyxa sp. Obi]
MNDRVVTVANRDRARPLWVAFVRDCELFSLPYPCTLSEGECVKPGGQPINNTSTPAKVEGESRRKAKAEGEAEGRRHMLSYRRLFAEGEGAEGEGGAHLANGPPGCFPDFYSSQDFDDWLQGKYQVPDYAIGSKLSPAGIIIWILHALGILLMVRV